jgi:hypothetical protein
VSETLKASFSLATKVQPLPAVAGAFAAAGGADVTAASAAVALLASLPPPPPQPAKRTATEQKSKCTGFN